MTTKSVPPYPASLTIDYPDRELDRVSTFFRIFYVIPIAIVVASIGGTNSGAWSDNSDFAFGTASGFLVLPILLLIVFREKYPRWWFDSTCSLSVWEPASSPISRSCPTNTRLQTRNSTSTST